MAALPWDELELPVLKWVHTADPDATGFVETGDLSRDAASSEMLPQLSALQVDQALTTLRDYGLIVGDRAEALDSWRTGLRVTGSGLRVLGEWPPDDSAALGDALIRVLRRIASDLPDSDDAATVRQAAGVVSRISGGAVFDLAKEYVQRLGEDLAS
jgi:hypothetical protein